jgi:hypothetical protein
VTLRLASVILEKDVAKTPGRIVFLRRLSEARKFAVRLDLANQYTDQLSDGVRAALIGNAGALIILRVGSRDAELLAPEFRPMEPGASVTRSTSRLAQPRTRQNRIFNSEQSVPAT